MQAHNCMKIKVFSMQACGCLLMKIYQIKLLLGYVYFLIGNINKLTDVQYVYKFVPNFNLSICNTYASISW